MPNPVRMSIPGGRSASFSVSGEGALTTRAIIELSLPIGTPLESVTRERGNNGYFHTAAYPETRIVMVRGQYSYHGQWYDCPDGRLTSGQNGGNTTVASFDDNGANNSGDRDHDFNDCVVRLDLT
jgi:hypothetical protein